MFKTFNCVCIIFSNRHYVLPKKIRIETRMCRRDNKPTRDQKTAQDQQLVFDTAKKKKKKKQQKRRTAVDP